jgi:hypothetical protein
MKAKRKWQARQAYLSSYLTVRCIAWLDLNHNIFSQGFEPLSAWLHHSDGYMTGFARVDVPHHTGFARMDAADSLAVSAIPEFA